MTTRIPKWPERQKLLYSRERKGSPAKLAELGRLSLEKGYLQDAFEYFRGANDAEGLGRVKQIALEEGDVFLFDALERAAGTPYPVELWNQIGYRAFELGKYAYARKAFERTNNELMTAKIRATLEEAAARADAGRASESG